MQFTVFSFFISFLIGKCVAREYWFFYTGADNAAYVNTYYDAAGHCASLNTTLATIEIAKDVATAMSLFDSNR